MIAKPHIVILGAGPAGLGAAYQLTRRNLAEVTVLERSNQVGGIAGSFEIEGVRVDYGSHRLHPSCDPQILSDLQALLGNDLLNRPRHGRIRLHERWIHFPLRPLDLALKVPLNFLLGSTLDLVLKNLPGGVEADDGESFASVLTVGLGSTICREFYFPYAQKIWGLPPDAISASQAQRRVSANSLRKMFRKIITAVPRFNHSMGGRFYYPSKGFGQIAQSLHHQAEKAGAKFYLGSKVTSIQLNGGRAKAVSCRQGGEPISFSADHIWSTIPLTSLVESLQPPPPPEIIQAHKNIQYRAMILVYLLLEQGRFSEYDAHYFPSLEIPIARLSEPKNYSNVQLPRNRTVLCAEIPCSTTDPMWTMEDHELGSLVCDALGAADIPVMSPIPRIVTRRLSHAYPIYALGYEMYFNEIDNWVSKIGNLLTFGRQGLFAHDNTHQALYMAYAAVDCLDTSGNFNRRRWSEYRRIFENHVVED